MVFSCIVLLCIKLTVFAAAGLQGLELTVGDEYSGCKLAAENNSWLWGNDEGCFMSGSKPYPAVSSTDAGTKQLHAGEIGYYEFCDWLHICQTFDSFMLFIQVF